MGKYFVIRTALVYLSESSAGAAFNESACLGFGFRLKSKAFGILSPAQNISPNLTTFYYVVYAKYLDHKIFIHI